MALVSGGLLGGLSPFALFALFAFALFACSPCSPVHLVRLFTLFALFAFALFALFALFCSPCCIRLVLCSLALSSSLLFVSPCRLVRLLCRHVWSHVFACLVFCLVSFYNIAAHSYHVLGALAPVLIPVFLKEQKNKKHHIFALHNPTHISLTIRTLF